MKTKEYYLMQNKPALESMQSELSRLSDRWAGNLDIAQATSRNMLLDDPEYVKWLDNRKENNNAN